MVSALVLSEFTLGSQAPVIRAAKAFPRVFGDDRAQLMFHVTFTPLEEEDMIAERVRQSKNKLRVDAQKDDYGHFSKDLENSKITLTAYLNMGTKVGVPIELKNLAMEGQFIIRFKFMSAMPYVSDVQVWFPDEFGPPSVDFQLQPLKSVDVLNVPGLNSIIDSAIRDGVKGALQYPGIKQDLSAMAAPPAESGEWAAGVLRFTVISAKDLPNMDTFSGASDPYAKALMGLTGAERELARTRVIKDT